MGQQVVELPPGSYVLIEIEVDQRSLDTQEVRRMGALQVAEIIGIIDLRYRGLVSDRIYEGVINTPGSFVWLPEGPLRLTAQPKREPAEVAAMVARDLASTSNLSEDRRERFRLAARWFRRGADALNPVDKLLFWWTVLEIYPAEGKKKVPQITSELIASGVYPDLTAQAVKGKLKLGRIHGARSDIVHHGKAFIKSDEEKRFSDQLERLEAVAVVCLRLLLGLPPGDELDRYVRDDPK